MREQLSCELCGRETTDISDHHLIPVSTHTSKWVRRNFPERLDRCRKMKSCQPCHKMFHKFFDEKTLARHYNTRELLLANEDVQNFVKWVKKQDPNMRIRSFARRNGR